MTRGRKPKPTALKNLHGSTEPQNPDEPIPAANLDTISPPDHFGPDMREVWFGALRDAPPGLLKTIDASVLEAWCVAHVLHRRAVKAQGSNSMILRTPTGYPIQSPYLTIINRQALVMMRAAAELGFSPTSRPRINVGMGGTDLAAGAMNGGRDAGPEESLDRYLGRSPVAPSIH